MNDSERLDKLIDLAWALCDDIHAMVPYPRMSNRATAIRIFINEHCNDDDRHVEGGRE